MQRTISVSANARPDSNGILWAMIMDRQGEHYAAHIARYLEVGCRVPAENITIDCRIYLGLRGGTLTGLLRTISEYFAGNARALIFDHAVEPEGYVNAGPDKGDVVGPALNFVLHTEAR
jgi:hypothetical protein